MLGCDGTKTLHKLMWGNKKETDPFKDYVGSISTRFADAFHESCRKRNVIIRAIGC